MSNTPHMLHEEFPGQMDRIHALKMSDERFAALLRDYDAVNDEIHWAETGIAPVAQDHETGLRRQRLAIKDPIAAALAEAGGSRPCRRRARRREDATGLRRSLSGPSLRR